MKFNLFVGSVAALLITNFPAAQCAPTEVIERRDFSADLRNFHQIQLLLHNMKSRIGIPFTAMRNVGLKYDQTIEMKPLDLVLLPNGYCFSCSTPSNAAPDESKRPNPFDNQMVEIDESKLLVACAAEEPTYNEEWPLMKACPGQERVLKDFLVDLSSHGSRLGAPKARIEHAPIFELNKRTCMPKDPKSTCSPKVTSTTTKATAKSSTFKTVTTSKMDLDAFVADAYGHKEWPAKTSAKQKKKATSTPSSTKAKKTSVASSSISGNTVVASSSKAKKTPSATGKPSPASTSTKEKKATNVPSSTKKAKTSALPPSIQKKPSAIPTSNGKWTAKMGEPALPTSRAELSTDDGPSVSVTKASFLDETKSVISLQLEIAKKTIDSTSASSIPAATAKPTSSNLITWWW